VTPTASIYNRSTDCRVRHNFSHVGREIKKLIRHVHRAKTDEWNNRYTNNSRGGAACRGIAATQACRLAKLELGADLQCRAEKAEGLEVRVLSENIAPPVLDFEHDAAVDIHIAEAAADLGTGIKFCDENVVV
jgi:hypothetical protein